MQPYLPLQQGSECAAPNNSSLPAVIMSEALRGSSAVATGGGNGGVAALEVAGGGAESLLPIVSSQRERFKQRNVELEAVRCIRWTVGLSKICL